MFRKMPFILMAIILFIILFDPFIPLIVKQVMYSISLSIKAIIIVLLPIIIFGLIFKSIIMLSSNATKIIGIILLFVCCSNFVSTFLSHFVGLWIYSFDMAMISPNESNGLEPMWELYIPKIIANDKAMFAGVILGLITSKVWKIKALKVAQIIEWLISRLLKGFVYFIPLFVAGFIMKLQYDGVVGMIIKDYAPIFLITILAQFGYILIAYFLLNNGKPKYLIANIKNMLPAAIGGFSSMSSAASMPLTIIGVENTAKNKDVAKSVVPLTVNIHLVGDCFAIPIFAYAILKSFGMPQPDLYSYLTFTFYFVLAKFSVAAIPGGGIIVMLPILEHYLGFNHAMMSLITALYILFDPLITCANVFGNGAFAKLIDITVSILKRRKVKTKK